MDSLFYPNPFPTRMSERNVTCRISKKMYIKGKNVMFCLYNGRERPLAVPCIPFSISKWTLTGWKPQFPGAHPAVVEYIPSGANRTLIWSQVNAKGEETGLGLYRIEFPVPTKIGSALTLRFLIRNYGHPYP